MKLPFLQKVSVMVLCDIPRTYLQPVQYCVTQITQRNIKRKLIQRSFPGLELQNEKKEPPINPEKECSPDSSI